MFRVDKLFVDGKTWEHSNSTQPKDNPANLQKNKNSKCTHGRNCF